MNTSRILISLIALFILPTFLCDSAFGDNVALSQLKSLRLTINTPTDSGSLSFRIRNVVELKLRQAGLNVHDNASTELCLNVIWVDIDPEVKSILGKYGTVQLSLHEPVFLARDAKVMTTACTWEGHIALLHGPPDSFADRTRQWAVDLVDAFLNQWLKARK